MKKDNIYLGIAIGIVVPFAFYGLIFLLDNLFGINHRESGIEIIKVSTLQLMAICLNLILLRFYSKKWNLDQSSKGIMVSIMVLAVVFIVVNYKTFFE